MGRDDLGRFLWLRVSLGPLGSGLAGPCDTWGVPWWWAAPVGREVTLGLYLAPKNNPEALFLLPWANCAGCVLVGGSALLGTQAQMGPFCKGEFFGQEPHALRFPRARL